MLVIADEEQRKEIQNELFVEGDDIRFSQSTPMEELDSYDVIFFMNSVPVQQIFSSLNSKTIFINEVVHTNKECGFPANVIRINGWPGFLKRAIWESAGILNQTAVKAVQRLGRKLVNVEDVPGLVSARVISSIINEAFKAREEKLTSADEINLAMKLGTNYPYGPFEWVENIGRDRVHSLLTRLAKEDEQYLPFFD